MKKFQIILNKILIQL